MQARDLMPFFHQARMAARRVKPVVPFDRIILDDWRGPRLVFDTPLADACPPDSCEQCPLFRAVGEDSQGIDPAAFRGTLLRLSKEERDFFPGGQRMLNCKRTPQYAECFGRWMRDRCASREQVQEEFGLIMQIRIVFPILPDRILHEDEARLRRQIATVCLLMTQGGASHKWVQEVAEQLKLL